MPVLRTVLVAQGNYVSLVTQLRLDASAERLSTVYQVRPPEMADFRRMAEAAHAAFVMNEWEFYDGKPTVDDLERIIQESVADIDMNEGETMYVEGGRIRVEREVIQEEGQEEPIISWNYYPRIDE